MFPTKENDRGNRLCIAFTLEQRMPPKTRRQRHVAYSLQLAREAMRTQQVDEEGSSTHTMEVMDELKELVGSTDALDTI